MNTLFHLLTHEHCLNPLPSRQEAVKLNADQMFACLLEKPAILAWYLASVADFYYV